MEVLEDHSENYKYTFGQHTLRSRRGNDIFPASFFRSAHSELKYTSKSARFVCIESFERKYALNSARNTKMMCALFFGQLNIYFFDSGTKQAERAFRLSSRSLL